MGLEATRRVGGAQPHRGGTAAEAARRAAYPAGRRKAPAQHKIPLKSCPKTDGNSFTSHRRVL